MKSKKSYYVLIPLVAIVWGLIMYKIFKNVKQDDFSGNALAKEQAVSGKNEIDTFSLLLNYRDPFLKNAGFVRNYTVQEILNNTKLNKTPAKQVEQPKVPAWPDLKYIGIIRNNPSDEPIAIVKINGKDYALKAGVSFNNIRVLEIGSDSVLLSFQDNQKYIMRKK